MNIRTDSILKMLAFPKNCQQSVIQRFLGAGLWEAAGWSPAFFFSFFKKMYNAIVAKFKL